MTSLEGQVQQLLDKEEIRDLLIEYGRTLDSRDFVAYSKLFARDGEWTGPGLGSSKGPPAILAMLEKNIPGGLPNGSNHIISNMQVSVDGDVGAAWCRWTFVVGGPDGNPSLMYSGQYADTLIREDGRWRFKSRVVTGDLPRPAQ